MISVTSCFLQIIRKEGELDQVKGIIGNKDQQAEMLQAKCKSFGSMAAWLVINLSHHAVDDVEMLRTRLTETEQELQIAR